MPANEVDHITPIAQAYNLRLDFENLQCLCKPCHSRKTMKENSHVMHPGKGIDPMDELMKGLLK